MPNKFRPHAVILNPHARGGTALRHWNSFLNSKEGAQFKFIPLFHESKADSSRLLPLLIEWIRVQIQAGARNFVAAGGDGTVGLTLNALLKAAQNAKMPSSDFRLGAIALGSSNDFHKPFESPGRTQIKKTKCRIDFENAFLHDIGVAQYSVNSHQDDLYFIVNASVGLTAEANLKFNQSEGFIGQLKKFWTNGAILAVSWATFRKYKNFPAILKWDDDVEKSISLSNLSIVKNRHFAGSFHYDQVTLPDCGTFGVHLAYGMTKPQILRTLAALSRGKFSHLRSTKSITAQTAEISSELKFALEIDGEVITTNRATFKVQQRELYVCP